MNSSIFLTFIITLKLNLQHFQSFKILPSNTTQKQLNYIKINPKLINAQPENISFLTTNTKNVKKF